MGFGRLGRTAMATSALIAAAFPALAAAGSAWNYAFHMGIGQYMTGEWDSAAGGALNLSCGQDGQVSIMAQIKGQAPPARSELRLTASSRAGSAESRFPTDDQGSVRLSQRAPEFTALWRELRARDIVTVRYADDRTVVLSLDGASKTLPAKPCD